METDREIAQIALKLRKVFGDEPSLEDYSSRDILYEVEEAVASMEGDIIMANLLEQYNELNDEAHRLKDMLTKIEKDGGKNSQEYKDIKNAVIYKSSDLEDLKEKLDMN